MGKALREIMEMFQKTDKFPEDPAAYCHEVSELYSQSAEKILKILGRDSLLKTPEDVGNVILSLKQIENKDVALNWRVEKMKLSKDETQIIYNDFLTLGGIPS